MAAFSSSNIDSMRKEMKKLVSKNFKELKAESKKKGRTDKLVLFSDSPFVSAEFTATTDISKIKTIQ